MANAAKAGRAPTLARDLTGRRLGRYEVLTVLASGGMATVYVARAQGVAGFERLVAVKVLHPHLAHDQDFISMFLDEARLAARIRHPNVVGTLDISDTQGEGFFLVMEYVEGDHFGALLRQAAMGGERLPVAVVARIVMDALSGLSAAHRLEGANGAPLEIVHRDVSPHNILVGHDGAARITDFGVAKAQVRLSSTRDGQFKGKLSYMAPEQAASGVADQRSDLFSMGIVLWEGLTGRRLFRGENNAEVLNKILNPQVPPPSAFDEELAAFDAVTAKALAREPDDRYQSADEFLEAIEEAAAQAGGVATPRGVGREVERWLGDKVAIEREAIRSSTDALGRSDLIPGILPRPEGGSQPSQPQSTVRAIDPGDATLGAKPSTLEEPRRRNWLSLVLVTALLFVAGIAVALVVMWPEPVQAPGPRDVAESADIPDVSAPDVSEPRIAEPRIAEPVEPEPPEASPTERAAVEPEEPIERRAVDEERRRARQARRHARREVEQASPPPPEQPREQPPTREPEDDRGVLANPYSR